MSLETYVRFTYENVKKTFQTSGDFYILIDGFALMFEVIQNKHLNWTKTNHGCIGGSYLHFLYCVERYLGMLLKLKDYIKIVFFDSIEALVRKSNRSDLNLAYELMIFHLKKMPRFTDNLIFTSISSYNQSIQKERIAGFMAYNYQESLEIGDQSIKIELKNELMKIIEVNVRVGISTFLSKDFWYDSDYGRALFVLKTGGFRSHSNPLQDASISLQLVADQDSNFEEISRISFYHSALSNIDLNLKKYFILHLYLLEKIPLSHRKIERVQTEILEAQKYVHLFSQVRIFKSNLANLFFKCNHDKTLAFDLKIKNHSNVVKMCDIFDDNLFYRTVFIMNEFYDNKDFQNCLIDSNLYANLFDHSNISLPDAGRIKESKNWIGKEVLLSSSINLDNLLFKKYLNEFSFLNEQPIFFDERKSLCDSNLDEYKTFLVENETKLVNELYVGQRLKLKQKFALYLENYSKSFQLVIKSNNIYIDLRNMIEKPEFKKVGKQAKNAELYVYNNQVEKYAKQYKSDSELIKKFKLQLKSLTRGFTSYQLLSELRTALKNSHSYDGKRDMLNIYLDLLMEQIENRHLNAAQRELLACDYYSVAEASMRVFTNDENLSKRIRKDLTDILERINQQSLPFKDSFVQFQLDKAQLLLHREHFGRPDKRVLDFIPDAWQIELMDLIDDKKSCIVVAPTSSGKTFASFYAFQKFLSKKDDSIVVYVAPTKALINQVIFFFNY
jgi:hypothetical protein